MLPYCNNSNAESTKFDFNSILGIGISLTDNFLRRGHVTLCLPRKLVPRIGLLTSCEQHDLTETFVYFKSIIRCSDYK